MSHASRRVSFRKEVCEDEVAGGCDALALYVELFVLRLRWNESPQLTICGRGRPGSCPTKMPTALCVPRESSARRARRRNPLHLDCSENRTTFNPGNIGSLYGHIFHIYTPLSDSLGISKVPDINMFGLKRIFILTSRDFTGAFSLP